MKIQSKNKIEQPLGRILSHVGRNFLYLINRKLPHLDIKRNFYALLLIEQGKGEITQQELANLLNSDKVSVVRIINYLSKLGYVKRIRKNTDKRKYCLLLTRKAIKDLPKIKKTLHDVTNIACKRLTPTQIEEFSKALEIIKNNLNIKSSSYE